MYRELTRGEKNCIRRAIGQKVSQEMLNAHQDKIEAQIRSFFGVISCADDKGPTFEKISVKGKWTKNCETYDFSIFGAYKYKDTLYRVEKYARIYTDIVYSGFIDSIDSIDGARYMRGEEKVPVPNNVTDLMDAAICKTIPQIIDDVGWQIDKSRIKKLPRLIRTTQGIYINALTAETFISRLDKQRKRKWEVEIKDLLQVCLQEKTPQSWFIKCQTIELAEGSTNQIKIKYSVVQSNECSCPTDMKGSFAVPMPLTDNKKIAEKEIDDAIQKKLPDIAQKLCERVNLKSEKYDYVQCIWSYDENENSEIVVRLVEEAIKGCHDKIDNPYFHMFSSRSTAGITIEKTNKAYHIVFPCGQDIVLKPADTALSEQYIPTNPYGSAKTMKKQPLPSNMADWRYFGEYLNETYADAIDKEGLQNICPRLSLEIRAKCAIITVGPYRISLLSTGFSKVRNFPMLDNWTKENDAFDFAQGIVKQAIETGKEVRQKCEKHKFAPVEVDILNFIKEHPGASASFIRTNVKSDTVMAKGIDRYMAVLFTSPFIDIGSGKSMYGNYESHFLNHTFDNVDFSQYVRPYTLKDLPLLKPEKQVELLIAEYQNEGEERTLSSFKYTIKLPKKLLETICLNPLTVESLNSLSAASIDYVKAALLQATGNDKLAQKIFGNKDVGLFEKLADTPSEANTETMADLIMEMDAKSIIAFFSGDTGRQYLSACGSEQLETLADALACVTGCKGLSAKIGKMAAKKRKVV